MLIELSIRTELEARRKEACVSPPTLEPLVRISPRRLQASQSPNRNDSYQQGIRLSSLNHPKIIPEIKCWVLQLPPG